MSATTFMIIASLPFFLMGGLASLVRADLGFDERALGLAGGAYFATSALWSVPGGRLAERLGARRTLVVGALLATCSMAGIALVARTWWHLAALIAVSGIANGTLQPAINLSLARGVAPGRQGIAFGIKQSAVPMGTLLAGLSVPLVGLTVGWRWAYGGAAVATLALLALIPPSSTAGHAPDHARPRGSRLPRERIWPLVRVASCIGAGTGTANAMSAFFVESAVTAGQPLAFAGLMLSAGSVSGIVTRLAFGLFSDRTRRDLLRVVAVLMLGGASGFVALGRGGVTGWLVFGALMSFAAGWGWAGMAHLAIVREHMEAPGEATGIAQAATFGGGIVGPILFGWIVSTAGYATAWAASAGALAIAACVLLWERRHAYVGSTAPR